MLFLERFDDGFFPRVWCFWVFSYWGVSDTRFLMEISFLKFLVVSSLSKGAGFLWLTEFGVFFP